MKATFENLKKIAKNNGYKVIKSKFGEFNYGWKITLISPSGKTFEAFINNYSGMREESKKVYQMFINEISF